MKQNEKDIYMGKGPGVPRHCELEYEQGRNSTRHSSRGWHKGDSQRLSGVRKASEGRLACTESLKWGAIFLGAAGGQPHDY